MKTDTLYRTKATPRTWLGVSGTSMTIARSKNAAERCGDRVEVIRWTEDADDANGNRRAGDTVLHHCKGDGRTPEFQSFAKATISDATPDQIMAWAAEALA